MTAMRVMRLPPASTVELDSLMSIAWPSSPALCRPTFRTKAFYTARPANAAHHAASKKLFSKCLVDDPVVRHHGEPDHNGNKRYLRAYAQNDIVFDPLVGMNPAMKSLKAPHRFMRAVGVNVVEGIGQHGPEGAE